MFELPPNLPPVKPVSESVIEQCVSYSSQYFRINSNVIKAIILVEGGKSGTMSRNSNGTYDMGVMQINTIHLPDIQRKYPTVTWRDVAYDPCVNIGIGTWILSKRLKETNDYWVGVGNYHSKTPKYRNRYLKKIYEAYNGLLKRKGKLK
ncbi:lytic transglycosylase domain-containing protein [Vibrio parahaemolyticus]|uniref:lytic transglycosylase domain-containing protein n=1 Tax=Vibrio parahaemolyticus TaxID=670 RepID=UPI00069368C6